MANGFENENYSSGDSGREFDYSWDDQDPDQMNDLVSGMYEPDWEAIAERTHDSSDEEDEEEEDEEEEDEEEEDEEEEDEEEEDEEEEDEEELEETRPTEITPPAYSQSAPETVKLDQRHLKMLEELSSVKEQIKDLQIVESTLRKKILEIVNGNPTLFVADDGLNTPMARIAKRKGMFLRRDASTEIRIRFPELYKSYWEERVTTYLLLIKK
jgi:hypothetical protein